jgi:N-acetylmuramoyl-L-alanine amidase
MTKFGLNIMGLLLKPRPVTIALTAACIITLGLGWGSAAARKSGPPRGEPIRMVVIHSTGGPTCDARTGQPIWVPAGEFQTNMREIEAHPTLGIHYMIDRNGALRASVPEHQIAHHVFRYSARSIAIELVNDGDGKDPFPEAQLSALVALLQPMLKRHGLRPEAIVRHSDLDQGTMPCAPTRPRKVDPGPAFPYEQVLKRVAAAAQELGGSTQPVGPAGSTPQAAGAPPTKPRRP